MSYIKVICEGCIKRIDPECLVCQGTRFYYWDPVTYLCYSDGGRQLFFDEGGEKIPIVRKPNANPIPELPLEVMLQFIESWIAETPVRKWKLLLDESGWQSCVWINRYKHSCVQVSEKDFNECIKCTYRELERIIAALQQAGPHDPAHG